MFSKVVLTTMVTFAYVTLSLNPLFLLQIDSMKNRLVEGETREHPNL